MSDTSHGWFVLGWLADVYYDAFADLYTATIPQLPQVQSTAGTRQEALAELQMRVAAEVGPNPEVCDEVN